MNDAHTQASVRSAPPAPDPSRPARPDTVFAWWRRMTAREIDHEAVLARLEEDARWSGHYLFMIVVSAGIAVIGLLLSSPAVVIGAMLISPMMGPIIALGFAIALFDTQRIVVALRTLVVGIVVAVLFCAVISFLSPLQTVTSEIAARTRPNLFDLGVAMLSGAAGTYAMIRGRHGAIVGVAIAVAVMPPLATVGFGLASSNRAIVFGATFLFVTNLTAISLTAAVLARIYGFAHQLSPRQSWIQGSLIVGGLVALAIPLSFALRQIAWESVASREVRDTIAAQFGEGTKVGSIDIDFDHRPLEVDAVVFTPRDIPGVERLLANRLSAAFERRVAVSIEQVRLGGGDAEADELSKARGIQATRQADEVAARLALAAGTSVDAVLVDQQQQAARVRAATLPSAGLATYRALEQRVAQESRPWRIELIPPLLPLPQLPTGLAEEQRAAAEAERLAVIRWAALRLRLPVTVSGDKAAEVAAELVKSGVAAQVGTTRGPQRFAWRDLNDGERGGPTP